ncbi:MAG: hypothetical protein IJR89_05515, partial [Clostridia bacterium]|nr:hypothetical protein [Clostridia bacterium]
AIMKIYRYMHFDEFENTYLNKYFRFRYSAVWEDSLESLFVKYASSLSKCKKLVDIYKKRYPNMPDNDIYTEITNIVALSLQTRCQCWCTNGNSDVFWKRNKDYICLGIEYVEDDEFLSNYKIKGHNIKYIEQVDIEKIVDFFEEGRYLSNLQIVKDKGDYEEEEEYRLVATPMNPVFPQKIRLFQYDEIIKSNDALIRSIVDYTKWVKRTVLNPSDEYVQLHNLKITSIRVHPEMSQTALKRFDDFCNKFFVKVL